MSDTKKEPMTKKVKIILILTIFLLSVTALGGYILLMDIQKEDYSLEQRSYESKIKETLKSENESNYSLLASQEYPSSFDDSNTSLLLDKNASETSLTDVEQESSLAKDNKVLSNKDIDKIFIGFMQEKQEKERLEKLRKERLEKERKERLEEERIAREEERIAREEERVKKSQSNMRRMAQMNGWNKRAVYSHNSNFKVGSDGKIQKKSPPIKEKRVIRRVKFSIQGIVCNSGRCKAITKSGTYKVGDEIGSDEKILKITKTFVTTNVRTIEH